MEETSFNIRKCIVCGKKFISSSYENTCSICDRRLTSSINRFEADYQLRIGDCVFYPYGDSWIEA